MARYVVLNCEDTPTSGKGAAEGTLKYLKDKWETKAKTAFPGTNRVIEHRCVRGVGANATLASGTDLTAIRNDCMLAEKIYVVMHGDPRHTTHGFANRPDGVQGVTQLGTADVIANFLQLVMPVRTGVYNVGLVMCYGARSARYLRSQVDHRGMVPVADLKTSFAYRLYYEMCQVRSIRMTAVTGKVSSDIGEGTMVENEMLVDEAMAKADAQSALAQSKGTIASRWGPVMAKHGGSAFDQKTREYKQDPTKPAATDIETLAKDWAAWQADPHNQALDAAYKAAFARLKAAQVGVQEKIAKYGKFVYTYSGGTLSIVNKYGATGGVTAGTVLYQGPLLAPG